jgi:bacteriocin-like protein
MVRPGTKMSSEMTYKARKSAKACSSQEAALTDEELNAVSGGAVALGLRKSAGNQASGVMFLAFSFKLVSA